MYDWAWSAFSTTIVAALLGPYLLALAEDNGGVTVAGFTIDEGSFFPLAVSVSALLQVIVLPLVGAVADHTDHKKALMMGLAYTGSALLLVFFFVTGDTVLLGGVVFVFAALAFAAATVVYNSYLPELVPPERRDRVSSVGYAYGYLGGGLWLGINLAMIFLLPDTGLAVRLSLAGTGVWCLVFFALYPGRLIRPRPARRRKPANVGWAWFSATAIVATIRDMRRNYPRALLFLVAYLFYADGISTVGTIATSFAADELDAEADVLLVLVLIIQFVAVPGALGFGLLAGRIGAKRALIVNLVIWAGLVIYAFAALDSIPELIVMGMVLAIVLGGALALSRSLFAQMIPASQEAEYFGFFEIAARGTSWLGPLTFAIVNQAVGSQRLAILSLIAFFLIGLALVIPLKVREAMLDAGQDPEPVTI